MDNQDVALFSQPVPKPEGLEERLLCIEVSAFDKHIVMMVMDEVVNIATFTNFLPLADRVRHCLI